MTSEENLRDLRDIAARLARLDNQRAMRLAGAIAVSYAELRWLEKDYEDQRNGDWTR